MGKNNLEFILIFVLLNCTRDLRIVNISGRRETGFISISLQLETSGTECPNFHQYLILFLLHSFQIFLELGSDKENPDMILFCQFIKKSLNASI